MSAIVFADGELARLRERLLADAPNEATAVLVASRVDGDDPRLLVRETHIPSSCDVEVGPMHARVAPAFFMPLLKSASRDGSSLVFVHTHPFTNQPQFSSIDDAGEVELRRVTQVRAPERPHAALVLGAAGFDARSWGTESAAFDVLTDVGEYTLRYSRRPEPAAIDDDLDRTVRAIGAAGQRELRKLTVAIVGLGGLGSHVAQQLAHLAVGTLVLVDDDDLERSNLNRVVGANASFVGESKVSVAAKMIRDIRSDIRVIEVHDSALRVSVLRKLRTVDAMFCCTDTHGSRAVLNQLAYQYYIPTFDTGVRIDARDGKVTGVRGRVQMLAPGLGCLLCSELLDPVQVRRDLQSDEDRAHDPYVVGHHEPQPAVVSLNGTIASMAVTMFLGAMTGFPSSSRYQIYRADTGVVRSVQAPRDSACIVCSATGMRGRGDLRPLIGRSD